MLTALLLLGHVCDLPAFAEIVTHAHGAAHHTPDHHQGDSSVSCDALVGLRPSPGDHLDRGPSVDAAGAPTLAAGSPAPVAVALPAAPESPPRRLPLFLLHAALLI